MRFFVEGGFFAERSRSKTFLNMETPKFTFTSYLEESNNRLWGQHFIVPSPIVAALSEGSEDKRVVCNINGVVEYQCAMLPKGSGIYIISVNKARVKKLGLKLGDQVQVSLHKDESEYGLPVPEEFTEVLEQDPEAKAFWEKLTPGKQRTMLYIVAQPKSSDLRIERAVVIAEHLKKFNGKINFRALNDELKGASN